MRTDRKDFIPSTQYRKYREIDNGDGTKSFADETVYTQQGDKVSASDLNELSQNAVWPLQHSKSGSTHALTGLSGTSGTVSAVFTAAASYAAGDTFTVDGTAYTVQLSNGETAEDNLFVAGAAVPVVLDTAGKKVNFKAGGGLSNSKLALATAQESDVATGKTFYAGNNQLKTGILTPYKMVTGSFNGLDNNSNSVTITCGFQANYVMLWRDSQSSCTYSNGQGKALVFSKPGFPNINGNASTYVSPSPTGFSANRTLEFCGYGNDRTIYYTAFGV